MSSRMQKITLIALFSLCASVQAELYETRLADGSRSFSDQAVQPFAATLHKRTITHKLPQSQLPGTWEGTSNDGRSTTLTLRDDGSFVIDQRSDNTPRRLYMCGEWQSARDALALKVKAYKKRLDNGETEQAAAAFDAQAPILSARRNRLIVVLEGEQLVFDRKL